MCWRLQSRLKERQALVSLMIWIFCIQQPVQASVTVWLVEAQCLSSPLSVQQVGIRCGHSADGVQLQLVAINESVLCVYTRGIVSLRCLHSVSCYVIHQCIGVLHIHHCRLRLKWEAVILIASPHRSSCAADLHRLPMVGSLFRIII